jgi:hypothetical protein
VDGAEALDRFYPARTEGALFARAMTDEDHERGTALTKAQNIAAFLLVLNPLHPTSTVGYGTKGDHDYVYSSTTPL